MPGEANLIGTLPHANSIQLLPVFSTCRRRHGENEQEQQERMNRKNRWGLFFINGVGVKLAGWAHVATHWIECLVYLGCVYRLRDDLVYSSEKTQWCSINVTNQPHQKFIQFYTDLLGGEVGSELVFKEHHCRFNNQILTTVCNGQLCLAFEPAWFSYSCCQKELKYQFSVFFSFVFNGFSRPCAKIQFWKQLRIMITNQYNLALVVWSFQKPVMAAAAKGV